MSFDASTTDLKEEYSTLKSTLLDLLPMISPPDRGKPSEIADKYMVLPEGMKYNSMLTPYMIEPMDLSVSRKIDVIIFVSSARGGKSISLIDAQQCFTIKSSPCDNLTIFPTESMARRYARLRFDKLVKKSPALLEFLTKDHNKDNVLNKSFTHGMSSWFSSPTPSSLAGSDYKRVYWSDADRGEDDNADGSIFTQLRKRTQTFGSSGMTIVESSPSRDIIDPNWQPKSKHEAPPVGGILGLYNDGDRRMYYWTCPHSSCGELIHMTADLELFCLPDTKSLLDEIAEKNVTIVADKYAKIYCPSCGGEITMDQKKQLNRTGKWIKENPEDTNPIASFWLSGLCATYQSWNQILANYFKAMVYFDETGDESKLKAVCNVDLGMPFMTSSVAKALSAEELESRAVDLGKRVVPEGVRFLTAVVDVQGNKFVVQVEGWGVGDTRYIIDRFDLTMSTRLVGDTPQPMEPPSYIEDWDSIYEDVIIKRYPLDGDPLERTMGIHMIGCDSGGSASTVNDSTVTENAYKFWKKMKDLGLQHKFKLLKGTRPAPSSNVPAIRRSVLSKQSSTARKSKVVGQLDLWLINTTMLKDMTYATLKKKTGNGVIKFPDWLGSWFYKEIVAEMRTSKGWENLKGRRNESFDLLVYAKCMVLILMDSYFSGKINWDHPPAWAEEWDKNSNVLDAHKVTSKEERKPRVARPVRGSFNR